jgi:hypothetical protein
MVHWTSATMHACAIEEPEAAAGATGVAVEMVAVVAVVAWVRDVGPLCVAVKTVHHGRQEVRDRRSARQHDKGAGDHIRRQRL